MWMREPHSAVAAAIGILFRPFESGVPRGTLEAGRMWIRARRTGRPCDRSPREPRGLPPNNMLIRFRDRGVVMTGLPPSGRERRNDIHGVAAARSTFAD